MSFGLNNDAEVALLEAYFNNESSVMGVYSDSEDAISDADSVVDVNSEPSGSSYARQTIDSSEVTVTHSNGISSIDIAPQTFNVSDSVQKIDAAFLYNSSDGLLLRLGIDTTSYPNDYIDTAELDNLRLGGDALTLE